MSADYVSKATADREFDPGYLEDAPDRLYRCDRCPTFEVTAGEFLYCERCTETLCQSCAGKVEDTHVHEGQRYGDCERCAQAANERAYERQCEDFHGSSAPQTDAERRELAVRR